MILIGALIIFTVIIIWRSVIIFKNDNFAENRTEDYKINPLYVNTDIPIEKALEDFKIIRIGKEQ